MKKKIDPSPRNNYFQKAQPYYLTYYTTQSNYLVDSRNGITMQSVANLIKIINLAKFQIFKTIRLSSRISKRNQTTSLLSSISKSKITVIKFSRLSDFALLNKMLNLQISLFMLKTLPKIWTSQIKNFKKDRKELADILKIHKNLLSWIFIFW